MERGDRDAGSWRPSWRGDIRGLWGEQRWIGGGGHERPTRVPLGRGEWNDEPRDDTGLELNTDARNERERVGHRGNRACSRWNAGMAMDGRPGHSRHGNLPESSLLVRVRGKRRWLGGGGRERG